MSRMTKFLKNTASWQQARRSSNGDALLDQYGDPIYSAAIQIKCRRERVLRDTNDTVGAIIGSSTDYYVDETTHIQIGDLLDGKVVMDYEEYMNEQGNIEGYRVIV